MALFTWYLCLLFSPWFFAKAAPGSNSDLRDLVQRTDEPSGATGDTSGSSSLTTTAGRDPYESEYEPKCPGAFSQDPADWPNLRTLPNGRTLYSYQTLQRFCAAAKFGGDSQSNVGGVCVDMTINYKDRSVRGYFLPLEQYADPLLRQSRAQVEMCRRNCDCEMDLEDPVPQDKPADKPSVEDIEGYTYTPKYTDGFIPMSGSSSDLSTVDVYRPTRSRRYRRKKCSNVDPESCAVSVPVKLQDTGVFGEETCNRRTKCTSDFRCDRTGTMNCFCKASSVDIASGLFGAIGCGVVVSQKHYRVGGRDLELDFACPCNASYVSRACCDSKSKLVWEPPNLRLGGLAPELTADL